MTKVIERKMLVGYMRVSKADGSQSTDLQRDALLEAGVEPNHLDFKCHSRPGLQLVQVFCERPLECGYRFFYLGQG